jgi:lactoylglutathione lyase
VFLHAMLRIRNVQQTLDIFNVLGLREVRRFDQPAGRFTLIFLTDKNGFFEIELTHNWDQETPYAIGDSFGHIAIGVENIYDTCKQLQEMDVIIARPPRDGYMAFVKTPDGISVELLQQRPIGPPPKIWAEMENTGTW